jgi:hypothetical protein
MSTKWFIIVVLTVAMMSTVSIAAPFAIQAVDHCMACNDVQIGPDSARREAISDVRNYQDASTTRRRVAFYSYDISALKQPGKAFINSYLTMNVDKGTSGKNLYVYAVGEEYDNIVLQGKTWNTLPGLVRNPAPTLGSEITLAALYTPELTPLLLSFPRPPITLWESSPTSVGLDDVLNADTDNNILLMFVTYDAQNSDFEICSPSHSRSFSTTPLLKGILLRGEIDVSMWASHPVPVNNAYVETTLAQLSWTNPEPNEPGGEITCDVYFGETEPNLAVGGYGLTALATGTLAQSVTLPSPIVRDKTYHWVVDVHDTTGGLTKGFVWSFNTLNQAPKVTCVTQYLWLNNAGSPASATTKLTATVTDDDYPAPLTYLWSQVSAPTGVTVAIDPNNILEPTVILPQAGDYTFRLRASDSNLQGTGQLLVLVRNTPCLAARAVPSYAAIDGDVNLDCIVDMDDFVSLAVTWLRCHPFMDAPCN